MEEGACPGATAVPALKRQAAEVLSGHRSVGVEVQQVRDPCHHTSGRCGSHCCRNYVLEGSTHQVPCQQYRLLEPAASCSSFLGLYGGSPIRGYPGTLEDPQV